MRRYPSVLNKVRPRFAVKLYVHYDDAWWINYLNLTFGEFNSSAHGDAYAPLQGRYHDGHTRYDDTTNKWRGFLEAVYAYSDETYEYYAPFQTSYMDPYVRLEQTDPVANSMLEAVHNSLVQFHKDALDAANVFDKVSSMTPKLALLSAWGPESTGFGGGVHYNLPTVVDPVAKDALQPFANMPIYVANEAFGTMRLENGTLGSEHGWAECSLVMAENILTKKFGLNPPSWIPTDDYEKFVQL